MKKNIKGSILIWSIFLMIFISSAFIFVSVGIKNQIFNNKNIQNLLETYSLKDKKNISKITNIGENENIELFYFDSFSGGLKQDEELSFSFLSSNTGSFNISSGGPIYYKVFSSSLVYSSGIIFSNDSIGLNGKLYLKNLGGYTNFSIDFSSSSGITFPYNHYKITKNIGGVDILKDVGKLK